MKVTALLPDKLVSEVKELSHGKNITDSLLIALTEWASTKKLIMLGEQIKLKPMKFADRFSAAKVRRLNRK